MKYIEMLSERIEDEIADAKKYAMDALEYKERRPELSKRFYNLSTQEMEHMKILHDSVVEIINEYRKTHGDPPADMQARYDWVHKKHIKAASEVKILQAAYREG